MKIIENKFIPFKSFKALSLFGRIYVRTGTVLSEKDKNHEAIHWRQQKELLIVFFLLWYGIEWVIRLFQYKDALWLTAISVSSGKPTPTKTTCSTSKADRCLNFSNI